MRKFIAIFSLFILTACTYPQSQTSTVNDEPTLIFQGASSTAEIYLNKLNIGLASKYNGEPHSLIVPKGTHLLEVLDQGKTILSQKIFISDGALKIFKLKSSQ